MYKRLHHQRIISALGTMNADFLRDVKCYFGGGTAISLLRGKIPRQAWDKASGAYGDSVHAALNKAKELLRGNPQYLVNCLAQMGVDDAIGTKLRISLGIERSKSPGLGH